MFSLNIVLFSAWKGQIVQFVRLFIKLLINKYLWIIMKMFIDIVIVYDFKQEKHHK